MSFRNILQNALPLGLEPLQIRTLLEQVLVKKCPCTLSGRYEIIGIGKTEAEAKKNLEDNADVTIDVDDMLGMCTGTCDSANEVCRSDLAPVGQPTCEKLDLTTKKYKKKGNSLVL